MRTARASGCRRAAPTASWRPTMSPAWGPPRSLSPEKHTSAAPARTERGTAGSSASWGNPSISTPEPASSITGTPSWHSSSMLASSTKPRARKLDG